MFKHGKHIQPGHKDYGIKPGSGARPTSPHAPGKEAEKPEAAQHTSAGEQHIEETHPGSTQPHPQTHVHAFHAHHTGGGRYQSHTHHGDGHPEGKHVETREHESGDEMHSASNEAFPPQEQADNEQESAADGNDFADEVNAGIGGTAV